MAPRATVQQAIEFLKIHQLRRENAAIYEQIQTLRDEVSDLHNESDENRHQLGQMQTDFQKCHILSIQNSGQISKANAVISSLGQDIKKFGPSFTNSKEHADKHFETLQAHNVQIQRKVKDLEIKHNDTEKDHRSTHESLLQELKVLQNQLSRKIDEKQVQLMLARSNHLRADSNSFGHNQQDLESTSCIYDSVEAINANACGAISINGRTRKSTVPDDLDLDEEAANVNYTGHTLNITSHDDTFVMLPYQNAAREPSIYVKRLLSLKQYSHEGLSTYIKRGCEIYQNLPLTSETVVIRRIVAGLTNASHRESFGRWLNQTSWSGKSFEEVARLHGVVGTKFSESQVRLQQEPVTPLLDDTSPCIPVQVSGRLDYNAQSVNQETAIQKVSPETLPRRSQRLAAKSQPQAQTQSTEALETESQAEALDARVASAAAKRMLRERQAISKANPSPISRVSTPPIDSSKSVELTKCKMTRQTKLECHSLAKDVGAQQHVDVRNVEPRAKVERLPDKVQVKSSKRLILTEDETTMSVQPDSPHTPTKQTSCARPRKILPQTPVAQPSSLLHGREAKSRSAKPQNKQTGTLALNPSPYNPQPRLVSKRNKLHLRDTHDPGSMSDCNTLLPDQQHRNQPRGQIFNQALPDPPMKKRKLPPPPQIPVLSTSSEDWRFDRW